MLWFCCLPVASLIVGRVQRSNLSKSGSEAHYSSTFTIMIKTKIHPHALLVHGWSLFWFIKAKKITDIPQTQAGFKAKSLGILCGFQGFLTQNPAAFVEIDDIFDVSDTPQASCSGKKHSGQSNGPVLFAPPQAAHRHYSLFIIIYYLGEIVCNNWSPCTGPTALFFPLIPRPQLHSKASRCPAPAASRLPPQRRPAHTQ